MYSGEERAMYGNQVIDFLKSMDDCVGIVQIGSGVSGYTDEFSDIDLMVATNEKPDEVTRFLKKQLHDLGAIYIKEGKFSERIFMLMPFFNNGLEMNISIMPVLLMPIRSPLWKVVYDKDGHVLEHLQKQMQHFTSQENPYGLNNDIIFEFAYHLRKFYIELARNNTIYAIKMLDYLRDLTLQVQGTNEGKKLHQFKAYHTLNSGFVKRYLETYPPIVNKEELLLAASKIKTLFNQSIDDNEQIEWDEEIFKIVII